MRRFFSIAFLFFGFTVNSQEDFVGIYKRVNSVYERHPGALQLPSAEHPGDSLEVKAWYKANRKLVQDSILPLTKKVINTTFPDIFFEDLAGKGRAISDFLDTEVIINYNYLYCSPCMDRIDSTEKIISGERIKLIVLFLDTYKNHISDLKAYGENVLIGFVNEDNADLISLKQGDNCMYYLNKNRQVEFFDKTYRFDKGIAWTNFLKEYLK